MERERKKVSKDLWTPEGNDAQTEIDIQIERSKFFKRRTEGNIHALKNDLDLTNRNIKEIEDHLALLRNRISIVSLKEYALLQSKVSTLKASIKVISTELFESEKDVDHFNERIKLLEKEKESLATKVLEFVKYGKKSRSKTRKR